MRYTSRTSSDGVTEQFFTLDEIARVLCTSEGARGTRPLNLLGHGGGQHKMALGAVSGSPLRRRGVRGRRDRWADHGDRPKGEEFGRIAAEMRAGTVVAPALC
ncbi:hypothetical protein [Streptomyces sp. NPDC059215]|uniref:hypothetical protein n=1 Tax=Streptomyces sp. NPDC059215 TaxID=3346772 RepID=UPI003683986C